MFKIEIVREVGLFICLIKLTSFKPRSSSQSWGSKVFASCREWLTGSLHNSPHFHTKINGTTGHSFTNW